MDTTTLTLGTLIDRTLAEVYRTVEKPVPVFLGADINASVTTITIAAPEVNLVQAGDVLEFGSELMYVRSRSVTPDFVVVRGWDGTTKASHTTADVGVRNPSFPRHRIARVLEQALVRLDVWVPLAKTAEITRDTTYHWLVLPDDAVDVYRISYLNPTSGRLVDITGWEYRDDLPTGTVTNEKVVRLPWGAVSAGETLLVSYRSRLKFTGAGEAATVDLAPEAVNLPVSYAVAFLASRREIGRVELDRAEEWSKAVAIQSGFSVSLTRELWSQFYRELDEVRRAPTRRRKPRTFVTPTRWKADW